MSESSPTPAPAAVTRAPLSRHAVISAYVGELKGIRETIEVARLKRLRMSYGLSFITDLVARSLDHLLFMQTEVTHLRFRCRDLSAALGETPFEVEDALAHAGEYELVHVDELARLRGFELLASHAAPGRGGA